MKTRIDWGEIGKCNRCGKPATTWFRKKVTSLFYSALFERYFCQKCLLEVLREQRVEKTKEEQKCQ